MCSLLDASASSPSDTLAIRMSAANSMQLVHSIREKIETAKKVLCDRENPNESTILDRDAMSLRYVLSTLWCLAMCLTIPELARGQQVTAAITGKVTDPSDSAIAGAKVAAKDIARGTVWTTETNLEGFYSLPRVSVGRYEVRVEMTGFQTVVHPAFEVVLNQTARLNFRLQLGVFNQTVEVQGAALLLNTDSMQLGAVIGSTTNEALPLATREYIQLALPVPGNVHPDPSSFTNRTGIAGTGITSPSSGRPYVN